MYLSMNWNVMLVYLVLGLTLYEDQVYKIY